MNYIFHYLVSAFFFLVAFAFSDAEVLQLFDGHNGQAAAIYAKENLLNNVLSAIPPDLNRDEWVAALPRALVAGFVKTDKDFQQKGMASYFLVVFVFASINYLVIWFCGKSIYTIWNLHINNVRISNQLIPDSLSQKIKEEKDKKKQVDAC